MSQLDVKNAFLNCELHDILLLGQGLSFSLLPYGLKQTPRAWFERFAFVVTGAGFLSLMTQRYLSTLLLVVGLFFLYILMT
jgi:hypothetical protein